MLPQRMVWVTLLVAVGGWTAWGCSPRVSSIGTNSTPAPASEAAVPATPGPATPGPAASAPVIGTPSGDMQGGGPAPAPPRAMASFAFPPPDETNRPLQVVDQGYVSSSSCRSCHAHHYATWHASYHRTMTQLVSPESVKGDFSNVVTNYFGSQQRFFREGDQFVAETIVPVPTGGRGPDGTPQGIQPTRVRMPLALVTGSHHAQVYWHTSGRGRRMVMMPYYYIFEERRWIPRNAAFLRPPGPDRPDEWGTWNFGCIRCHATHGRPRSGETFDTQVGEFGISCEACHGPGQEHVEARRAKREPAPRMANPAELPHRAASQVCGQCHSVWQYATDAEWDEWSAHGARFRPGDDLETTREVVVPSRKRGKPVSDEERMALDGRFWSDGMVRVSGREYNGLVDSPCYQRGELSCLSCHTLHKPADDPRSLSDWADDQLKAGRDGNQACLACHEQFSDAAKLAAHTHHAPDSTGAQCYNCHMPHTSYGIFKAIRSHQIDSPNAATSVATGRPSACNLCHLDQSLEWTASHLQRWYGIEPPELSDDQRQVAAAPLWLLTGDAGQRALIAWSMNWQPAQRASGTEWLAPFLAQLLQDPYPAVRLLAHRALRKLPGYEELKYDFVGPASDQEAANRAARAVWEQQSRSESGWSPAVTKALDEMPRLLRLRDDRPVFLLE